MAEDPLLDQAVDSSDHPTHHNNNNATTLHPPARSQQSRNKTMTSEYAKPNSDPQPKPISEGLDFRLVLAVLTLYLSIGTASFFLIRNQMQGTKTNEIVDSLYFCVVTMTTVGYGDILPRTRLARILALVFLFIGILLVGFLLSKAADTLIENQEVHLVRAVKMREKSSSEDILKEAEDKKNKYKFYTVLLFLVLIMIVGMLFMIFNEGLDIFDAFYGVCATITTLGYGDTSFSTVGGRLFAAFWILVSTICLAQFFYCMAELYTERRRKSLVKWVLTRKLTVNDLEAADLDNDNVVSLAEFVVYKLKEMGKITDDDIAKVTEWFKVLDIDNSGTLTKADLVNTGSSKRG